MIAGKSIVILGMCGLAILTLTGCSDTSNNVEPVPNCGWDTSVAGGQMALNDYLSQTDSWLKAHPRETPPAPSSTYWMGDCPNDGTVVPPPVDEAGDSPN